MTLSARGPSASPVTVTATASDPDGDDLAYSRSLEPEGAGLVEGDDASVTFTGAEPGAVTVTLVVTDGSGGEARAPLTVTL